ncbi:hypothetical protein BGZ68_007097 [Mortierella alpina]|nr:hypothetical protein BGZ68_007097 [Mortierella alpina]
MVSIKSTQQQAKGRPPATQVAQLAIKSAPTTASPASSPSSSKSVDRTQIADVVEAIQDIAALTLATPSLRTASGAPSPSSSSSSSGQGASSLNSLTSKPAVEDSIVIEDLLALGPAETDSHSVAKERVPEAMADLIDLDFSITIAPKHSSDAVDVQPETEDTKDLGEILKVREDLDLDHPWKQVKEDRMELASPADHEVELIDFSDDVLTNVPIAAVQSDDSPTGAPVVAVQNGDLTVSTAIAAAGSNDPNDLLTKPAIATAQNGKSERNTQAGSDYTDSDTDSDSETDSDGSGDGHEDPWTILDNGGILVKLKSLEEVKNELDRACYAWEDVLAHIKI